MHTDDEDQVIDFEDDFDDDVDEDFEDDFDEEEDFDEDDEDFDEDEDEFDDEFVEIIEEPEEERVYAIRPNKTQLKKDIAEIAALAEKIVSLTANQLKNLELPDNLMAAITTAATMPAKGARKRQLKYITAQLRKLDLTAITERIARQTQQSVHTVREHHLAERWRDRLISETGQQALTELLTLYPQADSQSIRQLQRNAKKEQVTQKPPKSARLLYKYLKLLLEQPLATEEELPDFAQE